MSLTEKKRMMNVGSKYLYHHFIGFFEVKESYKDTFEYHLSHLHLRYKIVFSREHLKKYNPTDWAEYIESEIRIILERKNHYVEQKQACQYYQQPNW